VAGGVSTRLEIDDVHLRADQIGREGGVAIILALGAALVLNADAPAGLDGDALAFHIAQLA